MVDAPERGDAAGFALAVGEGEVVQGVECKGDVFCSHG